MLFRSFEKLFVIAALLYFSGGVLPLLRGHDAAFADRTEIDPLAFWVQLFFYSITLLLISRSWRVFFAAVVRAKWVVALVLLAGASVGWSDTVGLSARHAISLAATTAFALYFGCSRTLAQQVRTLVVAFVLAGLLSTLFVIALPQYGLDLSPGHRSDWRGIYFHKNSLGRAMLLGFVSALVLPTWTRRSLLRYAGLIVFAVLMSFSASRTCMVAAAFLAAALPFYRMLARRITDGVAATAFALLTAMPFLYWLVIDSRSALALVGRDTNLTGRLPLWRMVVSAINERPWLGYGYDGFWLGVHGGSGRLVHSMNFVPAHAHNGFLDLALQLGVVGLALFTIGYFFALRKAFTTARLGQTLPALWPLMTLTLVGVYNLGESALLKYTDILWVVYAAAVVPRASDQIAPLFALEDIDENDANRSSDVDRMSVPRPPQSVPRESYLPARQA